MSDPKVPPTKSAGELQPGDRITAGFLPGSLTAADVLFVYPYTGRDDLAWMFVAYREPGYGPESERFLASSRIPMEPREPAPEHYEKRVWIGDDPGTCGAECACGLGYRGFDSVGEASRLLAVHIAASEPAGAE